MSVIVTNCQFCGQSHGLRCPEVKAVEYNPDGGHEMSATITIGWWVVPLAVTVIAFGWAMWRSSKVTRGSSGGFSVLDDLFYFVPAIVVSLLAWLIWAVLT